MKSNILKKIGTSILTTAMVISCSVPVLAAISLDVPPDVANDLANNDIIDTSRTAALNIYKYDMTAAEMGGVDIDSLAVSTGKPIESVENAMYDYAIAGVEFTYLRTGDVETYTINGDTKVVYELPIALADILELSSADAFSAADIEDGCTESNVYHYTSQQVNDALKAIIEEDDEAARDALEDYILDDADAVRMALTDENGFTSQSGLELGLYLLVETSVPENVTETVAPWFVQLPMTTSDGTEWFYDVTCYPKNQSGNPTLDKLVRNATGIAASDTSHNEGNEYLVSNFLTGNDASGTETEIDFIANREEFAYGDTTTASEGDVLDYLLVSKLPHISSQSTYLTEYTFVDILSEGLTYGKDVQIAIYASYADIFKDDVTAKDTSDDTSYDPVTDGKDAYDAVRNNTVKALAVWNADSAAYTEEYIDVTVDSNPTGETQLIVSVTDAGLEEINTKYSDYYIVVYYTATLNSDATAVLGDDGNPNDVTLTWERTSSGYYNTLEDETIVYTYGLNLQKNFSDNAGDATAVQFVLYDTTDGYYVVADNVSVNESGKKIYYVTGKCLAESEATVFSPDDNGALVINGIEADSYALTEIATDDGYSLLKDQLIIDINAADRDIQASIAGWTGLTGYNYGQENGSIDMFIGELVCGSAKVNAVDAALSNYIVNTERSQAVDSENALVNITVLNSKGFLLPKTGGTGLYVVTILGVFIVAFGCFCVSRKKKEE